MLILSTPYLEKLFPHASHLQGSVCVLMCILSAESDVYPLLQYLQEKLFWIWLEQWSCWCLA